MYLTVIIHTDKARREELKALIGTPATMEFLEFDDDEHALAAMDGRRADFLFTPWDLNEEKRAMMPRLRAMASLVFQIASNHDYDWIETLFQTPGLVTEVLAKPLRPNTLVQKIQQILTGGVLAKSCALAVDDDDEIREIMTEYLTRFGFKEVLVAANGQAALEILEDTDNQVEVVVSDWNMPRMNGIDLLAKIRAVPRLRRLPVVMVTGQTAAEPVKTLQAAQLGINGYVLKPFNAMGFHSQMESIHQELLRQRRAETYLVAARSLMAMGMHFPAEECLAEGIKRFPNEPMLLEAMGDSCIERADAKALKQAAEAYEPALRLSPLSLALVMKAFEAYCALGRMNDAIRVMRPHLHRAEGADGLHTRLGRVYLAHGEHALAAVQFKRALTIAPTNTEAQMLLAQVSPKAA